MTRLNAPRAAAFRPFALLAPALLLLGLCAGRHANAAEPAAAAPPDAHVVCAVQYDAASGSAAVTFESPAFGKFTGSGIRLAWDDEKQPARCTDESAAGGAPAGTVRLKYEGTGGAGVLTLAAQGSRCVLSLSGVTGKAPRIVGRLSGSDELLSCRVAMKDGKPQQQVREDIFETAYGRASNRRMNAVYSLKSFWALYADAGNTADPNTHMQPTADLQPVADGYTFRSAGPLTLQPIDLWPVIGKRRGAGVVPREWVQDRRPFPWPEFSPVQLPYICMTDPRQWELAKQQIDFLADKLRDYGFYCYGEWPVTQYYPEYDPNLQPAWLAAMRQTCDYAHSKGIKILRWVTDPDIDTDKYPALHAMMESKGWLVPKSNLLDYSHPDAQAWITDQYAKLAATGPDFYWVDNCGPTPTIHEPNMGPLAGFRQFYAAIQKGLLSTGRKDILIRSGASQNADYSAAGILDVYAPGPDVCNTWFEQALYVAIQLAREDYLCQYNLWRRSIDDYFPGGPQTIDQTRAAATMLAFTGLGFTVTDIGLPNIPPDRLELLRQITPIGTMRPLDIYRFDVQTIDELMDYNAGPRDPNDPCGGSRLPRIWTVSVQKGDFNWQLLAVFNWGQRTEQEHFISFEDLGLDPDREYLVFDFFSQKPVGVFSGGIGCRVAPTSARSFSIHAIGDRPFLVSTDRHITQGVVDTDDLKWDPENSTLSGVFTAGVKGRTYHLTVYAPVGWIMNGGGLEDSYDPFHGNFISVPIVCNGRRENWKVTFRRETEKLTPLVPEASGFIWRDIRGATVIDLRKPETATAALGDPNALLKSAADGAQVIFVTPRTITAEIRKLQAALQLRWGTVRGRNRWPGNLTLSLPDVKSSADTLLQTTCASYATNCVSAFYRPIGHGGIFIVGYDMEPRFGSALGANPAAFPQALRDAQAKRLARSFSLFRKWEHHFNIAKATIRFSPLLKGLELSTYTAREGIWGDPVFIPQFDMTFNENLTLQPLLDYCDPQSPPDLYDYMYRRLPAAAVWWGENGENNTITHHYYAPAKTENLGKLLPRNLMLRIETPGEIGTSDLAPLPPVVIVEDAAP